MQHSSDVQTAFRNGLLSGPVPSDVTAQTPDEIERRYAVYRNNVVVSLIDAMFQRFPVVCRLVGEEFAKAMFGVFVRSHPPQSPLMMSYGEEFPSFAESFEPVRGLPYLADVARLELARGRAYHAADATPLSQTELGTAAEADPSLLYFQLHPSVQFQVSSYPVYSIWLNNQPAARSTPVRLEVGETVLVARDGLEVVTLPLEPGESVFAMSLKQGASFAEAANGASERDCSFDPSRVLARLISHRLLVGLRTGS